MAGLIAGLLLILASPVFAQEPDPTSRLIKNCVTFGWTEPTGAVDYYEMWVASPPGAEWELLDDSISGPPWETCNPGGFNVDYEISVVAVNSSGPSEPSDPSIPFKWVHPMNPNDDGAIGFPDLGAFIQSWGKPDPEFDHDNSGTVDFPDFGNFTARFGTRNNGVRETSWPSTFTP